MFRSVALLAIVLGSAVMAFTPARVARTQTFLSQGRVPSFEEYLKNMQGGGASAPAGGAKHVGAGGMADTRDPEPMDHRDSRMSISKAPSFEEYLKRQSGGARAAAPAPAPAPMSSPMGSPMGGGSPLRAAPAPAAPSMSAPAPAANGDYLKDITGFEGGSRITSYMPKADMSPMGKPSFGDGYQNSLTNAPAFSLGSAPAPAPAAPAKSSGGATSFEEYMKSRGGSSFSSAPAPAAAAPAPAPVASSGAAPAPTQGDYLKDLHGREGPGVRSTYMPQATMAPGPTYGDAYLNGIAGSAGPAPASSPYAPSRPAAPAPAAASAPSYMSSGRPAAPAPAPRMSAPAPSFSAPKAHGGLGAGGMADTRDPEPMDHNDPRMSISRAPTFEEYLKKQAA